MKSTIVVYESESRRILAVIPLQEENLGFCRNDIGFQRFDDVEPVIMETENGIYLKDNAIWLNTQDL